MCEQGAEEWERQEEGGREGLQVGQGAVTFEDGMGWTYDKGGAKSHGRVAEVSPNDVRGLDDVLEGKEQLDGGPP